MALLQISEPGAAPDPHTRRLAVGIDLGTTHSLVAAVRNGVAECLPDATGAVLFPSAVRYLPGGGRMLGAAALVQVAADPANTIVSAKRFMGRSLADIVRPEAHPYAFVDAPGMVRLVTADGVKSPVDVSAEILAALRQRAEDTFDADIDGAVVTVPAYFDDAQRTATKDAARMAGLQVLRLVSEPTAAAIAYGLDHSSEGVYAVYDLGGGTFDFSLLRLTKGVFDVIATGGDSALGGDDFDRALADAALQRAGLATVTPTDKRTVLVAARAAKERLSGEATTALRCTLSMGPVDVSVERTAFDALTRPLIDRTIATVRRVLRDAAMRVSDVQGVVMVGGATRMPAVQSAVAAQFGRAPLNDLDPDQVVALGAALQADALVGNRGADGLLLLDVLPLSLGLETMGGLVERIIPRNSSIPTARAQEFTTYQDGQTALAVHVVQGERELVAECRSLARFELRGIPPMVAGAARIRVSFEVDADGLLNVSARELTSDVTASIAVKPSYGLGDDTVTAMLKAGFGAAESDMQERNWREARLDAERLLAAIASALAADGDLLTADERAGVDDAMRRVRAEIDGRDAAVLRAATDALAHVTEPFAAERMNRGIRRALAGRSIEDV